jgi:hypothetical protein
MMGEGKCFMHMVLVVRHLFQEDHKIPEAAVGTFLRDSIQPFSMDQQFQTKQHIFFVYENDHSHGFREGWRIKGLAKMDQEMILDSYLQMFPRVSRCRMGTLSSMSYDDAILMPFNRIRECGDALNELLKNGGEPASLNHIRCGVKRRFPYSPHSACPCCYISYIIRHACSTMVYVRMSL